MIDVTCFDSYGEVVTALTQWDINQILQIKNSGITSDNAPKFHFCNKNSNDALVVAPSVIDTANDIIEVEIPNELLQQAIPLIIYLYTYSDKNEYHGMTRATIKIPVRARPKPSDYVYEPNVYVISVAKLKEEFDEMKSAFEEDITEIQVDIDTIQTDIDAIQTNLNLETKERTDTDNELQATISKEHTERVSADNELEERLVVVENMRHTHENKNLLDSITAEDIDYWNGIKEQVTQTQLDAVKAYLEEMCFGFSEEFNRVYSTLGITVYDGGIFGMEQSEISLDGGDFTDEIAGTVDCGNFEPYRVTTEIGAVINGGNY